MFALQRLLHPALQRLPSHAATRRLTLQSVQFFFGLAQCHRNPPLLPAQQFLTLHYHQSAIQFPDPRAQPCGPHVAQFPSESLHRSPLHGVHQRQLRGAMAQGERNQGGVSLHIQIQFQLFAP